MKNLEKLKGKEVVVFMWSIFFNQTRNNFVQHTLYEVIRGQPDRRYLPGTPRSWQPGCQAHGDPR